MSTENLLVINAGSSSLKFHLYQVRDFQHADYQDLSLLYAGNLSGIGTDIAHLRIQDAAGQPVLDRRAEAGEAGNLGEAQAFLAQWFQQHVDKAPVAVGHRIVHGGAEMHGSVVIDDKVLDYLESLTPLAPLHQHNNLAPVYVIRQHWPELLQVACFDTAFHHSHSDMITRYAVPAQFYEQGVRRYGFHGLSYQYIAHYLQNHLPELYPQRVVVAHLGSGASACMMQHGRSLDTTMGFTALEGLPMGTRPGRLDAGVVLWWMQEAKYSADEIQDFLYNCSGMKGLSGISADMRILLESEDLRAKLALDYYAHHSAECLVGLGVIAQGIDAIIFTAGVGENSAPIRAMIAERLSWLGAEIDQEANENNELCISTPSSKISLWVIPTNEELMIARDTLMLAQRQLHLAHQKG